MRLKIEFLFKWFDFWIGFFYDIKNKHLYIFPIPMFGILIKFIKQEREMLPEFKYTPIAPVEEDEPEPKNNKLFYKDLYDVEQEWNNRLTKYNNDFASAIARSKGIEQLSAPITTEYKEYHFPYRLLADKFYDVFSQMPVSGLLQTDEGILLYDISFIRKNAQNIGYLGVKVNHPNKNAFKFKNFTLFMTDQDSTLVLKAYYNHKHIPLERYQSNNLSNMIHLLLSQPLCYIHTS